MSKYIDKEELWERLKKSMVHLIVSNTLFNTIKAVIDGMPTIEVSEDCISRVDLFEKMQSLCTETDKGCGDCHKACDIEDCLDFVMDAPSVIPQVKEGEWIDRDGWKFCSECDNRADKQANGVAIEPLCTNYCCECGAKMKGAEDE